MDDQSFDRVARLLGGTATRRGGIFAAVATAIGLTTATGLEDDVFAEDAADDEVDAEKKKKKKRKRCRPSRGGKGTRSADVAGADADADAESDADAEKKRRRRSRCTRSQQCCSLLCKGRRRRKKKKHHKGGRKDIELNGLVASEVELDEFGFDEDGYEDFIADEDDEDDDEALRGLTFAGDVETEKHRRKRRRRGFCRCRKKNATCKVNRNCCNGRACVNGVCAGEPGPNPGPDPIPTGVACANGDVCKASTATCTTYASGNPAGTYCLLADGDACKADGDCVGQSCKDGVCKGAGPGPSDCVADADCTDPAATTCTAGVCTCGGATACSSSVAPICCAGQCVSGTFTFQTVFGAGDQPWGVTASKDGLTFIVTYLTNQRIDVWTRTAADSTDWTKQTTITSGGTISNLTPIDVALSDDGLTLLVANSYDNNVLVLTRTTATGTDWTQQASFGTNSSGGDGPTEFDSPDGVWISTDGLTAVIGDRLNDRVSVWTRTTPTGTVWTNQTTFGSEGSAANQFDDVQGVALMRDGLTVVVPDYGNSRMSVWTRTTATGTDWTPQTTFGGPSSPTPVGPPLYVAVAADGLTVMVPLRDADSISIWTRSSTTATDWTQQTTFGGPGTNPDQFGTPYDGWLTNDLMTVLVSDADNDRLSAWRRTCPA